MFQSQDLWTIAMMSQIKTQHPLLDALLTLVVMALGSYLTHSFRYFRFQNLLLYARLRHAVTFEGKHNCILSKYETVPHISVNFSDAFKALLHDILENMDGNSSVCEIKEYLTSSSSSMGAQRQLNHVNENMYIISQPTSFLYHRDLQLYAQLESYADDSEGDKKSVTLKSTTIAITIYSYVTNVQMIKAHIEVVKDRYLRHVETMRHNKKFIYTLTTTQAENDDYLQNNSHNPWLEYPFQSVKHFGNVFFDGKDEVVRKIEFFLNNKEWYARNGIPYTLGIGLSGAPGTGKTSFFKCLANLTGRHLVVISLKLVKTKAQLERVFMEDRYSDMNMAHAVGFDKKIIVFEDMDCMDDIVIDRRLPRRRSQNRTTVVEEVMEKPERITLDDILNLWDGLNEATGRIMGITSNFYDKLDPALTRPGRIDITLHMENASRDTIREMFSFYYSQPIPEKELMKIKDRAFSPAYLINLFVMHRENPQTFLKTLLQ
jgi:hypothetical protein